MKKSDDISLLVPALVKAQSEMTEPLIRNKTVTVRTRSGNDSYEFEYADLDAIIKHVRGPLTKNDLWFAQTLVQDEGGRFRLETTLLHASGQYISSIAPIFTEEGGGNQKFGSALTFQKRYQLAAILGVAADTDDDANSADGNEAVMKSRTRTEPNAVRPQPLPKAQPDSPAAIAVISTDDNKSDWVSFGQEFIAAAKSSQSAEIAYEWLSINQAMLAKMEKEAPKVFKRLSETLSGIYPEGLR